MALSIDEIRFQGFQQSESPSPDSPLIIPIFDVPIQGGNVLGDISGGATSAAAAIASDQIEEFASEGGGKLPRVYGEHVIGGHLIVHKFTAGTPNTSIVFVALMEGQGADGGHGECEAAVAVYYAGEAQSVSPDGSTAGYRFYNGFISTAVGSGPQQVDAFLTSGLAYSGTGYIAAKLTDAVANAEDRPERLKARIKGRRTFDFDISGRILGTNTYSVNPARIAADVVLCYYERKFPGDALRAQRKLQDKIDWEFWKEWHDFNAVSISWDNGTSTVSIPRFDCHVAFVDDVILADALDQICATAGAHWQLDGERIIFLPPTERAPVHHFNESNIVRPPRLERRDLRERPNYFTADYRDFDDTFFGLSSVEVRRSELIRKNGGGDIGTVKTNRAFPPMRKSQADRLLDRQARLEADNPVVASMAGDETSIHVLPGDFVTVSFEAVGWEYQRCLVLSVSISSGEDGVDIVDLTVQKIEDLLYSDFAHGQRQEPLSP